MGKDLLAVRALGRWFGKTRRLLPWRDRPTLYRVWISEIMLQQTQVATVVPYFERFLARFPSVEKLAEAREEDVLLLWAGLGYYSRARNLHRAAKAIVERGGFPLTRDEWLEIPGVGPYTAGAIVSIALDQPEPILDGNVERVLSRVHAVARDRGDAAYKARLWELAARTVREGHELGVRPSVVNQALMELGATHCSPRKPACELCPFERVCRARARGEMEAFPPRRKPKAWVDLREELHLAVDGDGRVLLRRREAGEWRAGLWDLLEEKPRGGRALGMLETRHVVTRHRVTRVTHVWRLAKSAWKAAEAGEDGIRWVRITHPDVPVGSAVRKTVQLARERFPELTPVS
jgi:A/G-specific adenine glycosylase